MPVHVGRGSNAWESSTNTKQMQTAHAKRGKTRVLEIKKWRKIYFSQAQPYLHCLKIYDKTLLQK